MSNTKNYCILPALKKVSFTKVFISFYILEQLLMNTMTYEKQNIGQIVCVKPKFEEQFEPVENEYLNFSAQ